MPVYQLSEDLVFPSPYLASKEGLLAIGGDLSPNRLLLAYSNGIFPWYSEGEPILWWSPDPRLVLYPAELKVSRSLKKVIKQHVFDVTMDRAFEEVITNAPGCAWKTMREPGLWMTWSRPTADFTKRDLHTPLRPGKTIVWPVDYTACRWATAFSASRCLPG